MPLITLALKITPLKPSKNGGKNTDEREGECSAIKGNNEETGKDRTPLIIPLTPGATDVYTS